MNQRPFIPGNGVEKPRSLSTWLDLATRDLVPAAQARVRPEIEAHYAEAVQAHQVNGASGAEAQAAALADLGDAAAAARRFGRQHLTKDDFKNVFSLATYQICLGTIWALCNVSTVIYTKPVGPAAGLTLVLGVILLYRACRVLLRRSRQVMSRRMVLLLWSLLWLNIAGFVWANHFENTSDPVSQKFNLLAPISFVVLATSYSFDLLRARKKLTSGFGCDLSSG